MRKRLLNAVVFDERRLTAKSYAAMEDYCQYSISFLQESQRRLSSMRLRSFVKRWHRATIEAQISRHAKQEDAALYGTRLCLRRAIQFWQLGVKICKKEREMNLLVEAKWRDVSQWLLES